jgi:hypothetical protein
MDDLSPFCCLNSECPDHGVRGGGNLSVCGPCGKAAPIRLLRCRACGDRFSERKGTPLFRSHGPPEKATAVLEHGAEGCGVRPTERLVGVHLRHGDPLQPQGRGSGTGGPRRVGRSFPPRTHQVPLDETWAFGAKTEAPCDRDDPADDTTGDSWDHVAFDPEHRLVVAVVPEARDTENTEALVTEFRRRTGGRTMDLMTSDSSPASETAILAADGATVTPPRTGKPGRPQAPDTVPRAGLT